MKTLYDLLGARPDDDAEGLRDAFRKAAKASRSDIYAGNPGAPKQFKQIVDAYDILRDAGRRATYDRLRESERGRFGSKLHRAAAYLVHNIVSDAIGVVALAVVLAGGHTLFASVSKTPVDAVEATGRGPAEVASIQPAAPTGLTAPVAPPPDKPEGATAGQTPAMAPSADSLAANGGSAPEVTASEVTKGGPASSPAALDMEVAKADAFAAPVEGDQKRSAESRSSSQKNGASVPKPPVSDSAKSDDKSDIKTSDRPNITTHDMKTAEIKIARKPRLEAKRQVKNRAPVQQASLENRKTAACSGPQACSGDIPLFGVGF